MRIGYVRVSTEGQNTARQDEMMKELNVEKVYTDKASGKDKDRPGLKEMMNLVRAGDTVIVESISRFARSTKDLLGRGVLFKERGFRHHYSAGQIRSDNVWCSGRIGAGADYAEAG